MSDYEYTDLDGVRMNIDGYTTEVNLYLTEEYKRVSTIIPATHAPAVALAILEAAGYGKTGAAGFVRGQVEALVKQAEQEAEDAKVDAWRTFNKLRGQVEVGWKCLSEYERNEWRTNYNAARRFFEEEQ